MQLGREQTDRNIISRFSAKLGEALGKIDPKVLIAVAFWGFIYTGYLFLNHLVGIMCVY